MEIFLRSTTVALGCFIAAISGWTPAWAEMIFVDAAEGFRWEADCDRCTQVNDDGQAAEDGQHVEISVVKGDMIVFRQSSSDDHGIMALEVADAEKIRKAGDDGNGAQIVSELSRIVPGFSLPPVPMTTDVEIARVTVIDDFSGTVKLQCTVHFNIMTVTLKGTL